MATLNRVASLHCISLIIKGLHLFAVSLSTTQASRTAPLRPVAGFPGLGLLRELRQSTNHRGHIPLTSQWTFPSSHAGVKCIGEVAGRSLYPCVPQVDADAAR